MESLTFLCKLCQTCLEKKEVRATATTNLKMSHRAVVSWRYLTSTSHTIWAQKKKYINKDDERGTPVAQLMYGGCPRCSCPEFKFHLWPFAACHPPLYHPLPSTLKLSCQNKPRKAKKILKTCTSWFLGTVNFKIQNCDRWTGSISICASWTLS